MDCKSYLYNGIEIPNNEESKAKFMLAFNAQKRDENSVTILNNVNYGTTVTINGVEMILYDKKPVENIEGFQLYKYKLTPNNIVDKKLPTIKLNEDNIIIPSETMSESDFFETYPNGIVVSSQLSINPNKDLIDNNTITNPFNSTTLFEKWINSENGNIVKFEESNPNSLNIVIVGDKDPQLVKKFYKEEDKTVYLYTSKDNKETSNVINVYSSDKNGFQNLSNFLNGPIFILEKNKNEDEKQITYPTVEHYYQYRKAVFAGDLEAMTKILLAETGYEAQKIGKDIKNLNPEKWDEVSKDILRTTMLIAFAQNKENRDLLLSTGNAEFTHVSNTGAILGKWTEDFPKLLKEVRDIIRNTESFINHSGGADGGDINWDFIGCQFGFHNNIHYYTGEKSSKNAPYGNTIISDIDYEEGRVEAAKAAKRNFGYELDRMKDERLIRNWSQVKYSDAIFAVSNIVDKGGKLFPNLKDDSRVALLPAVTGGTGYAVGMAIIHDKPVYVFNQEANNKYSIGWYTWSEDIQDFVKIDTPILTENYAGIGSRELTKEGKEAIKNVFKKATDILNSKVSNVKEEAIQLETPEQIYKDLPKKTESGHVKLKPWEDLKEAEQAIVIASDKLFNPNDKVLKKGSVVKYNGVIYLFWSKSKSGQAQLIDMNGNKFSGTPNIDKLTVLGSYQTTMYNNTEYIVTDKDNIYSGASGKKVFADEEKTSKSRKDIILNLAKSNLPQSSYIISTRIRNSTEHFGNPFTHEPKGKTPGLIEVNSIEEAVERYIEWVLFDHNKDNLLEASKEVQAALNNPKFKEQRDWIRKQLQSGQLKGLDILYFTELKKPSHANALDYLINQYDWNRRENSNTTNNTSISLRNNDKIIKNEDGLVIIEDIFPKEFLTKLVDDNKELIKDTSFKQTKGSVSWAWRHQWIRIGGMTLLQLQNIQYGTQLNNLSITKKKIDDYITLSENLRVAEKEAENTKDYRKVATIKKEISKLKLPLYGYTSIDRNGNRLPALPTELITLLGNMGIDISEYDAGYNSVYDKNDNGSLVIHQDNTEFNESPIITISAGRPMKFITYELKDSSDYNLNDSFNTAYRIAVNFIKDLSIKYDLIPKDKLKKDSNGNIDIEFGHLTPSSLLSYANQIDKIEKNNDGRTEKYVLEKLKEQFKDSIKTEYTLKEGTLLIFSGKNRNVFHEIVYDNDVNNEDMPEGYPELTVNKGFGQNTDLRKTKNYRVVLTLRKVNGDTVDNIDINQLLNYVQSYNSTSTSLPSIKKPIDNQWYIYDRNQKKFVATTQSTLPDRYRGIINSDLNNSTIEVINELTKKFNLENYRLTVLEKLKSKLYPLLADRDMSKILFDIIYPNKIQVNDVGQHTFTYNNRTIKTDIPLDPSQEKALIRAIRLINGQQYGNKGHTKIITIQGMPGTGKTTIIGYLQKYFSKDTDNNFVYMTPTHSASAELAFSTVKTGNTQLPFTIASSFTYNYIDKERIYMFHNKVLSLLSSYMKRIIVIDECSMIPDSDIDKLISAVNYSGAFIIFLGDKKQNPPIEDSKDKDKKKYISKSLTDFETIDLEEIHRTSDINGLSLLYNTRQLTSFKLYSIQTDNIKFYPRNSAQLHFQRVIDSYRKDPDGTIYITYTNSVAKKYNSLIRDTLNGSVNENIKAGDLIIGYPGYSNKKISDGHLANSMKYEVVKVIKENSFAIIKAKSGKLDSLIELGIEDISDTTTFYYYPLSEKDTFFKSEFTKEDFETNNNYLASIFKSIYDISQMNISEESKRDQIIPYAKELAFINVDDKYIYNPTTDSMELYKYDTHKDLKISGIGSLLLDRGVDYGYAITAQKSQGSNYRRVFVDLSKLDSAGNTPIYDDEDNIVTTNKLAQFYVMASRFQIELHVLQDTDIPTLLPLSIEVQIGEEILKDNKPYIVYNTIGLTANVFSKNTKEKIIVSLSEIKSNNKIYLVNDNEIIIDETTSLSLNGDLIEKQVDIVENEIENKFAEDIEFEDVIDVPEIETEETRYEYSDGSEISDLGYSLSESNLNILSAMLDAVISEENKFTLEGDNMIDRTIMADIFITNMININKDFENYLYIVPNELMKSNSNIYKTITLNELDIQDVKMIVIDSYELFTQEEQEIIDNIDNNIFKLILTDSNNNTINTLRDRVLNYENEVLNNIIEDLENDNIEISDITTTSSSTGNIVVLKNKQQLKELKERDMYIIVEEKNYENNNRLLQTLEITPKYIVGNRVHLVDNIYDIETSEFRTINNPFPNISYIEGYSIKLEFREKSIFVVEVNIEFANQFKLLSGQEQLEFKKKYFIPLNSFDIDNNIDLDYIITIDRLLGTYENELIIISDFNNKDWFTDVLENVRHNVFILKNEFSRLDVLLNYPYLSDISKAILTNEEISKGFKDNLILYLDWNNYLPNENEDQLNEEDLQSIIDTDITKDSVIDFDIDPNMDTNLLTEEHKNKILKFITCKPQ